MVRYVIEVSLPGSGGRRRPLTPRACSTAPVPKPLRPGARSSRALPQPDARMGRRHRAGGRRDQVGADGLKVHVVAHILREIVERSRRVVAEAVEATVDTG